MVDYINTIERYQSLLKRGIVGMYHFMFKKYIDKFVLRCSTRKRNMSEKFNLLSANIETRTTYKGLING